MIQIKVNISRKAFFIEQTKSKQALMIEKHNQITGKHSKYLIEWEWYQYQYVVCRKQGEGCSRRCQYILLFDKIISNLKLNGFAARMSHVKESNHESKAELLWRSSLPYPIKCTKKKSQKMQFSLFLPKIMHQINNLYAN